MIGSYAGHTVLVTGGLGFIGRNLVDGLLVAGAARIIVVDDCSNSSPVLPEHWAGKVEHIRASVTTSEWLDSVAGADEVFHLACKTLLECSDDPVLDCEVNALATLRLLEAIRKMPDHKPRFIYTSSVSVYGITPSHAVAETFSTDPCSQYGVSKLAGEKYVMAYGHLYGLSVSAVRLSNVYGMGQTPNNPYCGVIGIFLRQALTNQPITVIGDGSQVRDFTFVGDAIEALLLVGSDKRSDGEVFNVSSSTPTSIIELAQEITQLFPSAQLQHIERRTIDVVTYRLIDNTKIKLALGWSPKTSLHDGLYATKAWAETQVA